MDISQWAPFPYWQRTALLVNPNSEERRATENFFERAQYRLLFAETTEEAIELCRHYGGPIHLLIADEELPDGAAWNLAEMACKIRPGLMVLFLPAASISQLETAAFTPRALWEVTQAISSKVTIALN